MSPAWKPGKRDVWTEEGTRVAEIVTSEWRDVVHLIAAAPELYQALEEMIKAYETRRDDGLSARMLNDHRVGVARAILKRAKPDNRRD